MNRGSFLSDTFEQLAELGQSTAQKTGQAVKQTISPTKIFNKIIGNNNDRFSEVKGDATKGGGATSEVKLNGEKHTPLDFNKLQQKYENQDKAKSDALRQRLFQLVKGGEEKVIFQKKQEEEEKKRKNYYEEQEKKRKAEQQNQKQSSGELPQGKVRRSIFSPKKVAKREQAEVKPASGKQ